MIDVNIKNNNNGDDNENKRVIKIIYMNKILAYVFSHDQKKGC